MTISILVLGGKQTPIDTTGLWETYQRMVSRSSKESDRLRRELEIAGDGAVVNAIEMFKLPEAYTADKWPTVALAPIKADRIRFTYQEHRNTGFHVKERPEKFDLNVTPPSPPVYTQEEQESEYRMWMATASVSLFGGLARRGKADHTGSVKVPLIPKGVMPKTGGFWSETRQRNYWVMFDSPVWQPEALPMDPYLLERLDDSRFRVLAHWDLSPKERQLMALIRE